MKMITLVDLSLEIIDRILFALDPLDIANVSQTSRLFHDIIYGPLSRQFWRGLYLVQSLDDPRHTMNHLGGPSDDDIDWKEELQRIMRARTVVKRPEVCRSHEERCLVLRTCIHLITHITPISSPDGVGNVSRNVQWMHRLLGDGAFFEPETWGPLSGEEEHLLARMHTLFGVTRNDLNPERRQASQAFVYSLRHYTTERSYGPYMPDSSSIRVDWAFLWMVVHDFGMLLLVAGMDDNEEESGKDSYFCPLGLFFRQSIIPRGLNLDKENDWAWVEGLWSVRYGFMDHREFILYNDPSVPDHEPQDTSIFDGTEESLASLDIYFSVTGIEPDPSHPTRPKINVVGEVDGKFNLVGFIKLTDDDQVRWHYSAGNDNQMVWNCEAVCLGNVRSQCGFIGVWSTVFHDADDPVGPFWMQRELLLDEDD